MYICMHECMYACIYAIYAMYACMRVHVCCVCVCVWQIYAVRVKAAPVLV